MMIESIRDSRKEARNLQVQNGVPEDQCGPWFHGTCRNLTKAL